MVEEMHNCNSLENTHGCIKWPNPIAQGHYCKFTGKVLHLPIDPQKLQKVFTSNDLQYMVGENKSKYVGSSLLCT